MTEDIVVTVIIPAITAIAAFIALLALIWNISRNYTTLKLELAQLKETHTQDKIEGYSKVNTVERDLEKKMVEGTLQRKEEISKSLENQKDDLRVIDKQIDLVKIDVKDVTSKINTVSTKSDNMEENVKDLRVTIRHNYDSLFALLQRLEDKLEKFRDSK